MMSELIVLPFAGLGKKVQSFSEIREEPFRVGPAAVKASPVRFAQQRHSGIESRIKQIIMVTKKWILSKYMFSSSE